MIKMNKRSFVVIYVVIMKSNKTMDGWRRQMGVWWKYSKFSLKLGEQEQNGYRRMYYDEFYHMTII